MNGHFIGLVLVSCVVLLANTTESPAAERPNFVLMLADDQGWNGLSVAMHPSIAGAKSVQFFTPNLERLASQGMRFSSAYAPAPVCSPTRISLQTGKSPAQLHWTKAAPPESGRPLLEPQLIKHIDTQELTIAELLGSAGYATAHYGKWHIGGGGPGAHGYDEHDGDTGNEHAYKFTDPNPVDIFGMAERAAKFMSASQQAGKPFFIQLSWNALHAAELARQATLAKYQQLSPALNPKVVATAAITEDLDCGVGIVMDAVERLGLSQNTYLIYLSDNGSGGGGGRRGGLSGGKGSLWEGGVRVPMIVTGPGIAGNSWCHVPVIGYDLFPTLCELAVVKRQNLPDGLEGGSIVPLLRQGGNGHVQRKRDELVFHFPHYQTSDGPHSAIRLGDLKLIHFYESDQVMLFDLSQDISEQHDLANKRPDDSAALKQRLTRYLNEIHAQLPTVNAEFDPSQVAPMKRGDREKKRKMKNK